MSKHGKNTLKAREVKGPEPKQYTLEEAAGLLKQAHFAKFDESVDVDIRLGVNPMPYLLALATSSNIGSVMTVTGNPQNMLIGQRLHLPFAGYALEAAVPSLVGLAVVWLVVVASARGSWRRDTPVPSVDEPELDRWQTGKGIAVLVLLMAGFLAAPIPREVLALTAAAVLLTSRRMASREVLGQVDWHLLVLFVGLFVVNFALADSGALRLAGGALAGAGVDATRFDPGLQDAFSSNGRDGTLTIATCDKAGKLSLAQKLATPARSRTMTLDPKTHRIYVSAADFTPAAPAGAPIPAWKNS